MNIDIRWAKSFAACGGAAFASLLRRKRHNEKQTYKAEPMNGITKPAI
jgi:hypothetical protein